jgi:hypothetical protein
MQALPFIAIGAKALGSIVQGVAGYRADKYNRAVAFGNAQAEVARGDEQALRLRNLGRLQLGQQIGAQAESGFEIGTGTAIDSLMESATQHELDAMDAKYEAESRARSYRLSGAAANREGKQALLSGIVGAAGAIAGGVSDYATAKSG